MSPRRRISAALVGLLLLVLLGWLGQQWVADGGDDAPVAPTPGSVLPSSVPGSGG